MNRIKMIKQLSVLAVSLLVVVAFQNCAEQEFSTVVEPVTQTGGPNCREQLTKITTPIQLIFVMDVSGSNVGQGGEAATDPGKVMRGGSIKTFYDTYKAKTNFGWSMITFQGSGATTRLAIGDAVAMEQMITDFMNLPDKDGTPYAAALSKTSVLVKSHDPRPAHTKYMVVFMSDGKPDPAISDMNLQAAVDDITSTVDGGVSVSTLYYGPKNDDASNRLKMMAEWGGGNFLDTNANPTGNSFLISDLVVIPGIVCD